MKLSFKQRNVVLDRPAHVSATSIIFAAPRPLFGENWTEMTGPMIHGRHYAAVRADDPYRGIWIARNKRLDAVVVNYVTEQDARSWVEHHYRNLGHELSPEQMDEYWQDCFYQYFGEVDVELEVSS